MGKDGTECTAHCPTNCAPGDLVCPGGKDWNECEMPGFCHPGKGPMGKDGNECPSSCPVKCGFEEMQCNGGIDWNHCQMPDFCMPAKGTITFSSSSEFPNSFITSRTNW